MLHHESRGRTDECTAAYGMAATPVAVLAYRSRALRPQTHADLQRILRAAQERNSREGLSGLLVYDQGFFIQWLEGPRAGLMRVWESIQRDARHGDLKVLRQQTLPRRFFKGWDMRLARRTRGDIEDVLTVMEAAQELLTRVQVLPSLLIGSAWDEVFADAVIPLLKPGASKEPRQARMPQPTDAIWHARRGAGAELAAMLLAVDSAASAEYVDTLVDQGAGIEPLYHEVFEPAARCLGGLWEDDRCDDFNVTLAMGRLQLAVRRVSLALPRDSYMVHPGHAVLVAPQPGEPHGFNASMCTELFLRDGWDVSSEIPSNDAALRDLLHEQWFDVLDLSSSAALRRDQRLPAMRLTIDAARAASLNPALAVIVDGRSFFDRPRAYLEVGADLGFGTVTDIVPAAEHLLSTLALRRRPPPLPAAPAHSQVRAFFHDHTSSLRQA